MMPLLNSSLTSPLSPVRLTWARSGRGWLAGAALLAALGCQSQAKVCNSALSVKISAPTDNSPFDQAGAAFVSMSAEGGNPLIVSGQDVVVQPHVKGQAIQLSNIAYGLQRQVRVDIWSKDPATGNPAPPVLGRGISAPFDVAQPADANTCPNNQTVQVYVTPVNQLAHAVNDQGVAAELESPRAGSCAVGFPNGYTVVIGGATPKSGLKNPSPYDIANYDAVLDAASLYDPASRNLTPLANFGAKLNTARAFAGCAVGSTAVAVVGGMALDPGSNTLKPSKSIEFYNSSVPLTGQSNPFQVTQPGPECSGSCNPNLVFARANPSVVRMFDNDNYFLILGGQGDTPCYVPECIDASGAGSHTPCGSTANCSNGETCSNEANPAQTFEVACAGNTWEVWHPLKGNLAQGLLNMPRWNHGTVRIPSSATSGFVFLIGGENEKGPVSNLEVIQFSGPAISSKTNTCPIKGLEEACQPLNRDLRGNRILPGAAFVTSAPGVLPSFNYIVMAGGFQDSAKTIADNTVDVFNLGQVSDYVNEPGSILLQTARGAPMVAAVAGGSHQGQMLVTGGTTSPGNDASSEYVYFSAPGAAGTPVAKVLPVDPNGLPSDGNRVLGNAIGLVSGHVLVIGGVGSTDLSARTGVWLWNPF